MKGLMGLFLKFIGLILGIEEVGSFPPPLCREEEDELFQKMKEGDKRARERIIEHNLRLVPHIIKKYYSSYESPDELLSVGSFGLIKAADSFKSGMGTRFATYAARCIQNEMLMLFRSRKKLRYEVSLGDEIDVDKDGNPLTYMDIIASEEDFAQDIEMKGYIERLRAAIDEVLDEREREIIRLRYGLCGYHPLTQREVAARLGISRSYVSRIEKKALLVLKRRLGDCGGLFED
ncbi:MAG: RNA polymerase sporulation sigma factor SigK [Clostridia bacterium]|nr:RNA polymerase sporulation sigma factor SigK [Clostridia bacterium]